MTEKPVFVDLIGDATRQSWHRPSAPVQSRARITGPEPVVERSKLSHWPPERLAMWRLDLLTPWKKRKDPRG